MKKFITSLILCTCLITTSLMVQSVSAASPQNRFNTIETIGGELEKRGSQLPSYQSKAHPNAPKEQGISNIASALLYIIEFMKYILGSLAVILIILSAMKVVTEPGDKVEEARKKMGLSILYSASGFILIMIADQLVTNVFFGESGEVFESADTVRQFGAGGQSLFQSLYRALQSIIGTVAVLMFVVSGVQYALSGGSEDATSKAPKRMLWGAAGIMIIGVSELIVFDIFFPESGTALPRVDRAKELIASITNFASAFIATLAILGFIYAGYLYVGGGMNEENTAKAKKAITAAVLGVILSTAAFAISNTLTSGLSP